MNIIVRLLSIEPRSDGSGDIAIDAQAFTQEVVDGVSVLEAIPAVHKTLTIGSLEVEQALGGIDLVTQRDQAEAALFQLALVVANRDEIFSVSLIAARLEANAKSEEVTSMIKQIMGTGSIDVPVSLDPL
jgi:hypothetical protein